MKYLPPTLNGINGDGEYTAYLRAGEFISFNIPTFDNPEEIAHYNYLPFPGPNFSKTSDFHESGTFSWSPSTSDIGEHIFQASAKDFNVCGSLESDWYDFKIIVVCPYCELHVDYSNRTPDNNPLPPLTEMVEYIKAGYDGPVVVGEQQTVIFRAPDIDTGGPEFLAIGEYIADFQPVCTEQVCESCCSSPNEFREPDFISNAFTPNADNFNDVWYVPDFDHPYCAWNAQGFALTIYNSWGTMIYELEYDGSEAVLGQCCPFQSPVSASAPGHSSIFWDGIMNRSTGAGTPSMNGVYFYVLDFLGCWGTYERHGNIELLGLSARLAGEGEPTQSEIQLGKKPTGTEQIFLPELQAYPNPSQDFLTLRWLHVDFSRDNQSAYVFYDATGRVVAQGSFYGPSTQISLDNLSCGMYNCIVNNGTLMKSVKIVKQ